MTRPRRKRALRHHEADAACTLRIARTVGLTPAVKARLSSIRRAVGVIRQESDAAIDAMVEDGAPNKEVTREYRLYDRAYILGRLLELVIAGGAP